MSCKIGNALNKCQLFKITSFVNNCELTQIEPKHRQNNTAKKLEVASPRVLIFSFVHTKRANIFVSPSGFMGKHVSMECAEDSVCTADMCSLRFARDPEKDKLSRKLDGWSNVSFMCTGHGCYVPKSFRNVETE